MFYRSKIEELINQFIQLQDKFKVKAELYEDEKLNDKKKKAKKAAKAAKAENYKGGNEDEDLLLKHNNRFSG